MAKQDDWVRLTVRLPPDLYACLTDSSAQSGASVNAEIVGRLKTSFPPPGTASGNDRDFPVTAAFAARLAAVAREVQSLSRVVIAMDDHADREGAN